MYDVDDTAGSQMADKYGVGGLPTTVFIGKDEKTVSRLEGAVTKEIMVKGINQALGNN
jgi:thiol-disulfide isomerase/thioredoxin